jgi:soluble lytic murein transglycosylase-like protein
LQRDLLKAVSYLESGWNNTVVSNVGALGLGQLLPETVSFVNGVLLGGTHLDPALPEENIRMSARYIRYLLDQTGGDVNAALAAYYQGLSALRQHGMYEDTVGYVANVQGLRSYFS